MALDKPLETIEESDLQALVDNQVSERKTIEYKEALPGNADGDKKEFLADVSSFANASGGDLIYGISEQSGIPVELRGLELSNVDAEILRLESCIQTGIAPRLFKLVETHPVALPSKQRYAIIIRIRKSWTAPHMVTFKNDSKFFSRDSRGKHQLDASELRSAFLLSETAAERIRNFRDERLAKIIAGEMPAKLDEKAPKIVLHVIPFGAFDPTISFNVDSLMLADNIHLTRPLSLHPLPPGYTKLKYNVDGLLSVDYTSSASYTQVFSNGTIESVDTSILGAWGDDRITKGDIYEPRLLEALKRFLAVQKQLGGNLPLIVMISLLGVQDFRIGFSRTNSWPDDEQNHRIDRPDLVMPEAMIDSFDDDLPTIMKPIFDNIAQAANWPGSMMHDESGKSLHTNL
jgi:Putative DNA-binding domain